ncbi:MAG: MerC family mercury resistance protein [Candidatus Methylomirabilia bacterium]
MSKLGAVAAVLAGLLNLGCCVGVVGPLGAVLVTGGMLDRVPVDWRLPLLYGSVAVALVGFGIGWRRHRRPAPMLIFLAGAAALLYPFHEALDVSVLKVFIWIGFGLLLASATWDTWASLKKRRCGPVLPRWERSQ